MPTGISHVFDTLYMGCEQDAVDLKQMTEKKIAAVVRIDYDPESMVQINMRPPVRYHMVKLMDTKQEELHPHISALNDFVHAARLKGEHVLIHCAAGVSRNAAFTTAYLMSISRFNYEDAFHVVKSVRPVAHPNPGFHDQLLHFEKTGLEQERKRLRDKFKSDFDRLAAKDNAVMTDLLKKAHK